MAADRWSGKTPCRELEGMSVHDRPSVGVVAGFMSLALVAAACGGDDSKDSSTATTAGGATTTSGATATTTGGSTTTAPVADPQSIEEWEALWTKERAAIVKR